MYRRELAVVAAEYQSSRSKEYRKHDHVGGKSSFVDADLKNYGSVFSKELVAKWTLEPAAETREKQRLELINGQPQSGEDWWICLNPMFVSCHAQKPCYPH